MSARIRKTHAFAETVKTGVARGILCWLQPNGLQPHRALGKRGRACRRGGGIGRGRRRWPSGELIPSGPGRNALPSRIANTLGSDRWRIVRGCSRRRAAWPSPPPGMPALMIASRGGRPVRRPAPDGDHAAAARRPEGARRPRDLWVGPGCALPQRKRAERRRPIGRSASPFVPGMNPADRSPAGRLSQGGGKPWPVVIGKTAWRPGMDPAR